jgi:hypothetical protein
VTRSTLRQITVVVVLVVAAALALSAPGMAGAADEGTPAADLDGQPGQAQSGANTSQSNASSVNATVEIANQTTNGSTVTVQSVTLAQPGYVALHTSAYTDGLVGPSESVIAVSRYLPAGQYHNLTIDVSNAPPGNAPGLNRSRLNSSQRLTVTLVSDTTENRRYDYVRSFTENDTLATRNGSVIQDAARVRVPTPPRQTASVVFQNQTLQNNTLTVATARLPRGGFVIAHNASYQRTGDALTSAVAISRYLPPGNYTNVSLRVVSGALTQTQVVTVRPSLDTNDNQQYDFIQSGGFQDVAYETVNRSGVITDPAQVRVPTSDERTQPQPPAQTPPTRSATATPTPTSSATATPTTADLSGDAEGGSDGLFGGDFGVVEVIGILALALGVILVAREVR